VAKGKELCLWSKRVVEKVVKTEGQILAPDDLGQREPRNPSCPKEGREPEERVREKGFRTRLLQES